MKKIKEMGLELFSLFFLSHKPGKETFFPAMFTFNGKDLFVQLLFFAAGLPGGNNFHPDEQFPGMSAALDTLARNPERGVKLDSRRHLQLDMALVYGLDLNGCTHHGLCRRDLDFGLKGVPVPREPFMGLNKHFDEQVPVGGSEVPGFTISFHPQAHTGFHPGRDMDGDLPFCPGVTGTAAVLAYPFRDLTLAAALGAAGHADKLPEWRLGCLPHLTAPAAPGAGVLFFGLAA
jgi:hypothetical protein